MENMEAHPKQLHKYFLQNFQMDEWTAVHTQWKKDWNWQSASLPDKWGAFQQINQVPNVFNDVYKTIHVHCSQTSVKTYGNVHQVALDKH